jgi:hypothetical protein
MISKKQIKKLKKIKTFFSIKTFFEHFLSDDQHPKQTFKSNNNNRNNDLQPTGNHFKEEPKEVFILTIFTFSTIGEKIKELHHRWSSLYADF